VIPLVNILHCTRGITFLAHPVDSPVVDLMRKNESEIVKISLGAVQENLGRCIRCALVTILCRFQCAVAEVCALLKACRVV